MFMITQLQNLTYISLLFNALSLIGCLKALYAYCQASRLNGPQYKFLSNIIIADTVLTVSGFLNSLIGPDDNFYQINVCLTLIALWSSAYWTSAMALLNYKRISKAHAFNHGKFYTNSLYIWGGICIATPIVLIMVVFNLLDIDFNPTANRFDTEAGRSEKLLLFVLLEAVPFTIALIVTAVSCSKQIRVLKEFDLFHINGIDHAKLMKYPIGQGLVFLPCILCKAVYFANPVESPIWDAVRLFGYYLSGVINCFVYASLTARPDGVKSGLLNPKIFPSVSTLTRTNSSCDDLDYQSMSDDLDSPCRKEILAMKIDV